MAGAAAAGAQERRLAALERRLEGACEEASGGASVARAQQARLAALEWRTEQVPPPAMLQSMLQSMLCRAQIYFIPVNSNLLPKS